MEIDANAVAQHFEAELAAMGTPERAASEKRYLKSDLRFLGATVWQIRATVQAFRRAHRSIDHDQMLELVTVLWAEPTHELRMAAVILLELYAGLLSPADLPLLERLVRESKTWALVDWIAAKAVGEILAAHPDKTGPVLDRWSTDSDFWVRRTTLLAELRRLGRGADLAPFLRRADGMLDEKEFFIRKAIGWVLRDVGKRRPEEVTAWLAPRTQRASGVTMREAVKYLPPADAERLMAAYRERRPA